MPCRSISLAETVPIEGQVPLGGHGLEQLGREAVGLVHVGRLGPRDHARDARFFICVEDPLDAVQAGVDRGQEVVFFLAR